MGMRNAGGLSLSERKEAPENWGIPFILAAYIIVVFITQSWGQGGGARKHFMALMPQILTFS